jgi:hypothetical protein
VIGIRTFNWYSNDYLTQFSGFLVVALNRVEGLSRVFLLTRFEDLNDFLPREGLVKVLASR